LAQSMSAAQAAAQRRLERHTERTAEKVRAPRSLKKSNTMPAKEQPPAIQMPVRASNDEVEKLFKGMFSDRKPKTSAAPLVRQVSVPQVDLSETPDAEVEDKVREVLREHASDAAKKKTLITQLLKGRDIARLTQLMLAFSGDEVLEKGGQILQYDRSAMREEALTYLLTCTGDELASSKPEPARKGKKEKAEKTEKTEKGAAGEKKEKKEKKSRAFGLFGRR